MNFCTCRMQNRERQKTYFDISPHIMKQWTINKCVTNNFKFSPPILWDMLPSTFENKKNSTHNFKAIKFLASHWSAFAVLWWTHYGIGFLFCSNFSQNHEYSGHWRKDSVMYNSSTYLRSICDVQSAHSSIRRQNRVYGS